MKTMMRKLGKSITSVFLTTALVLYGMVLLPCGADTVHAEEAVEKTEANTKLGTGDIGYPRNNPDDVSYLPSFDGYGGKWSYVYFGKYNGQPVRYRVLDKESSDYGVNGGSMLLDCDNVLKVMPYNRNYNPDDSTARQVANKWVNSEVNSWLNGGSFLNSDSCFTDSERNAIAESTKAEMSQTEKQRKRRFQGTCQGG